MEKQKKDRVRVISGIEKGVSSFKKKLDHNDNGTLDINDVTAAIESVGTAISDAAATAGNAVETAAATAGAAVGKAAAFVGSTIENAAESIKENIEAKNREKEIKQLMPFFSVDLEAADFSMPRVVRLTEMDKRRGNSDVCKGSIGYSYVSPNMRILNVFLDKTDAFPIEFFPNKDSEVYFVDPKRNNRYIARDEYFNYLKIVRVNELQKLAQDLGAKHFRVIYKEEKNSETVKAIRAKAKAKIPAQGTVDVEGSYDLNAKESSSIKVEAECSFPGGLPHMPHLLYLSNEPSIQNLIAMRMSSDSAITQQKFSLKMSDSSGIKEKEAGKIDAALKAMKVSLTGSLTSAVKKEECRYLEYEIEF